MPVTITGAKYAVSTLTAAATTTVTVTPATFVSGDFGATQRMVAAGIGLELDVDAQQIGDYVNFSREDV